MEPIFCQGCHILRRAAGTRSLFSTAYKDHAYKDRKVTAVSNRSVSSLSSQKFEESPLPFSLKFHLGTRRHFCQYRTVPISMGNNFLAYNTKTRENMVTLTKRTCKTLAKRVTLRDEDIEKVLQHGKLPFDKGHTGYLTACQQCSNGISEKDSNLSLFVDMRTGESVCTSCGVKKDWESFETKIMTGADIGKDSSLNPTNIHEESVEEPVKHEQWLDSRLITETSKLKSETYHHQLKSIPLDVLQEFQVHCADDGKTLLFPYYDITREKIIGFKRSDESESSPKFVKKKSHDSLFGWHLIKPKVSHTNKQNKLILTTNELDCIAITAATGQPSLSLPNGASSLPPGCLPFLEQFYEIILWFGDGYRSRTNLQCFACKLSLSRCSYVASNYTNASTIFNTNGAEHVKMCIEKRTPMSHDRIVSYKSIRNDVLSLLINAKEDAGVPFERFPHLNDYLKGHRRGELTIFSGPTGSGKTTLLSELSLDLCMQGVRTLWGSFEIKNVRLTNMMLHQYSGIALEKHLEHFSEWSENFEDLPMYFMNYYGQRDIKEVLETMDYAIYTYDVEHIILDNLQFMLHTNPHENRFHVMDNAIARFRAFASKHNVHITLVIHPRKEDEGAALTTSSFYGSAKASQEADNVLILQSTDEKSIDVTKNRFDGSIGSIPLKFHPSSLCLSGGYRDVDTGEWIQPALKPIRKIQNLNVMKNRKRDYK